MKLETIVTICMGLKTQARRMQSEAKLLHLSSYKCVSEHINCFLKINVNSVIEVSPDAVR